MTPQRTREHRMGRLMLSLIAGLWSCASELADRGEVQGSPELAVAESPGTGSTGGNPASSLVVDVDVPDAESLDYRWEPPRLRFDHLRIRRRAADGTCSLERLLDVPDTDLTITAGTQMAFLREDVCEVGIRRNAGPVLHLMGENAAGLVLDVSLADGAELVMDVARWRAARQSGSVLSFRPRRLLAGLLAPGTRSVSDGGLMLSDADETTGPVLRRNLREAVGGYIDLDLDGTLSATELVPEAQFLVVRIVQ